MIPDIDIRQMRIADLATLHKTCCEIYTENFYAHWDKGGLEQYINDVFATDTLKVELSGKNIQYYVAFKDRVPVAFMKINLFSSLPSFDAETGMELDKIYIAPHFKGMKIGKRLLDVAFNIARSNKKEIFWLSVIDTNSEAISFYKKAGFRFHSKTRLNYPKFRKELRGMWRMYFDLCG